MPKDSGLGGGFNMQHPEAEASSKRDDLRMRGWVVAFSSIVVRGGGASRRSPTGIVVGDGGEHLKPVST